MPEQIIFIVFQLEKNHQNKLQPNCEKFYIHKLNQIPNICTLKILYLVCIDDPDMKQRVPMLQRTQIFLVKRFWTDSSKLIYFFRYGDHTTELQYYTVKFNFT